MNWYEWNSQKDFDNWHKNLCEQLGYPITSANQATGHLDENVAMTTAYTTSHEVEGKIIAEVHDDYSQGLKLTELRLPIRNSNDIS